MNKAFFESNEDFEKIIKKHLRNIKRIYQIKTGWTNFVFKADCEKTSYFFRFPRNDFFSNALLKEANILKKVSNKISLKAPNLKILLDDNRPFSIHKKIDGESLTECYCKLNNEEKNILAIDLCKLLNEFKLIKNIENFESVSNFLDNLSLVSGNNYDLSQHDFLKTLEKNELVFSHGDLNPGNLILKNHKLYAVIDFAFSGKSSPLVDLSRITGRLPNDFYKYLKPAYMQHFNSKLPKRKVEKLIKTWEYIEEKYIAYIKDNHPDIILP